MAEPGGHDFEGTARFQIMRPLGAGGMGVVYEAFDREQGSLVALKTLMSLEPQALLRFKSEFRGLQDMRHRNLVTLGEMHEHDGRWFFTMELVRGISFDRYVRTGPTCPLDVSAPVPSKVVEHTVDLGLVSQALARSNAVGPSEERRRVAQFDAARLRSALGQLAQGLLAVHQTGKVHRDIKPSNVLVTQDGRVVILDFGLLAEIAHGALGEVMGTPTFMAPEQARSSAVGPEADWYSLGVVLFHALTGTVPFAASSDPMFIKQYVDARSPSELIIGIPEDLNQLCADLLQREPASRPIGVEVLRRLGVEDAPPSPVVEPLALFVGREPELQALRAAFADSARDHPVVVRILGESGIGKSALASTFLDALGESPQDPLVLRGRCYERETVPYRAVDGVVDALSRYLGGLPDEEVRGLLPSRFGTLVRVFPVLGDVSKVLDESSASSSDPHQLRAHMFATLRQLFGRIAARRPMVVYIDDLQWADADSFALLSELLRPPQAPPLLLLVAERPPRDAVPSPGFLSAMDVRQIEVRSLDPDDASRLVTRLMGSGPHAGRPEISAILEEGRGHPLFLDELVRQRDLGAAESTPMKLDRALWSRIAGMEPRPRDVLGLAALSGVPLRRTVAIEALGATPSEFEDWLAQLRVARLVRTYGAGPTSTFEPYHDRVREAVLGNLAPDAQVAWHRRLVETLESSGRIDPETLLFHWLACGERTRAARYAPLAAANAAEALAFERAVRLYRTALELHPEPGETRRGLLMQLAESLINIGWGAEAATVLQEAARDAAPARAHELRLRAADQLLRSGHWEEGLQLLQSVMEIAGLRYPKTPGRAVASLILRRAHLRLRGLGFRRRPPDPGDEREALRMATGWTAAANMSMTDPVRAADLQTGYLLRALRMGDPRLIAQAMALEAGLVATSGMAGRTRAAQLNQRALGLAREVDDPYALAVVQSSIGASAFQIGDWKTCVTHCDLSEAMYRKHCRGVMWELSLNHIFALAALFYLGELRELRDRLPPLIAEADGRNDWYSIVNLRLGYQTHAWLAADDVDAARREADQAMLRWSTREYSSQHFYALMSHTSTDLYCGDPEAALRRVREDWPQLQRSLLMRVRVLRIKALQVRAAASLAVARSQPGGRDQLLRDVGRDVRSIEHEAMGWSNALAGLVRAGVAATRGAHEAAIEGLREAASGFDAAGMALHAAAARYRWGHLVGGKAGAAQIEAAGQWMSRRGIESPSRLVDLLAPGFVDAEPRPDRRGGPDVGARARRPGSA